MKRKGFTLVELIVVILIITILIALLIASIQQIKSQANKLTCANNLKQIGLGIHNYQSIFNYYPSQEGSQESSWLFKILPYVEADYVNLSWNSPIATYVCPLDYSRVGTALYIWGANEYAMTTYLCVLGTESDDEDGLITYKKNRNVNNLSNICIVGERPPSPDLFWGWWSLGPFDSALWITTHPEDSPYTECDTMTFSPGSLDNYCDTLHFWSLHNGSNWLYGDGHVEFLDYNTKVKVSVE